MVAASRKACLSTGRHSARWVQSRTRGLVAPAGPSLLSRPKRPCKQSRTTLHLSDSPSRRVSTAWMNPMDVEAAGWTTTGTGLRLMVLKPTQTTHIKRQLWLAGTRLGRHLSPRYKASAVFLTSLAWRLLSKTAPYPSLWMQVPIAGSSTMKVLSLQRMAARPALTTVSLLSACTLLLVLTTKVARRSSIDSAERPLVAKEDEKSARMKTRNSKLTEMACPIANVAPTRLSRPNARRVITKTTGSFRTLGARTGVTMASFVLLSKEISVSLAWTNMLSRSTFRMMFLPLKSVTAPSMNQQTHLAPTNAHLTLNAAEIAPVPSGNGARVLLTAPDWMQNF